jgi:Sulfotransferase family
MSAGSPRGIVSRLKERARRVVQRIRGQRPVHFLHIGKTGGTAVRYALREHTATKGFVIRLHPHEVKLKDVPPGEQVIVFLRDPVTRFVSAFFSRQRQGRPRYFSPWSPDEQAAFEHFTTPNQLALALSSVDDAERARAAKAMTTISLVKDTYASWLGTEEYFRSREADIFFVGFQESLNDDFEVLKARLGLPPGLALPADDVQAHRNPAHLDKRLDDAGVANLRAWYKDDYRFVELCHDLIERRGLRSSGPAGPAGHAPVRSAA